MSTKTCWSRTDATDIMLVDAGEPDEQSNRRFLATHVPQDVQMWTGRQWAQTPQPEGATSDIDSLASHIADAPMDASMCWVAGDPGTGKSHLVRWLWLARVRDARAGERTVFVPRSDTSSLRRVVDRIIGDESGEEMDAVREALSEAADSYPTMTSARRTLILELANIAADDWALAESESFRPFTERSWSSDHVRVARNLFSWLTEEQFLNQLLSDDGLAARVAGTRLGRRRAEEREEEDLVFAPRDLPLAPEKVERASAPARELHELISDDGHFQQRLVQVLNTYLDRAVQKVFGVRQGMVTDAALELRRRLKERGETLWLYFEDFAVLQGVQQELLDVFVDNAPALCDIRVVAAITPGPLSQLPTMVWGRTSAVVDLNMATGAAGQFRDQLVGRYLNAVRVGTDRLASLSIDAPTPNQCNDCPLGLSAECHEAFGTVEVEGVGHVGLYPFNRQALERAVAAKLGDEESQTFVPRFVITDVLRNMVHSNHAVLEGGRFPRPAVVDQFTVADDRIRQGVRDMLHDGCVDAGMDTSAAERLVAFQGLWGRSRVAFDEVPEGARSLFNLPAPPTSQMEVNEPKGAPPTRKPRPQPGGTPPATVAPPTRPDKVQEVDRWTEEPSRELPEALRRDVRQRIHARVVSSLGLHDGRHSAKAWSGRDGFEPEDIVLDGRAPAGRRPQLVHLDKSPEVALALEEVVWDQANPFLGGNDTAARQRRAADMLVDRLAEQVSAETLIGGPEAEHAQAVHLLRLLLSTGAVLGLHCESDTPEAVIDAALREPSALPPVGDPAWGKLRDAALGNASRTAEGSRQMARDLLLRLVAFTREGGNVHAVDFDRLKGPAAEASASWVVDLKALPRGVQDYARTFQESLAANLGRSLESARDWAEKVQADLDGDLLTMAKKVRTSLTAGRGRSLFVTADEQRVVNDAIVTCDRVIERGQQVDTAALRHLAKEVAAVDQVDERATLQVLEHYHRSQNQVGLVRSLLGDGRAALEMALSNATKDRKDGDAAVDLPDPRATVQRVSATARALKEAIR